MPMQAEENKKCIQEASPKKQKRVRRHKWKKQHMSTPTPTHTSISPMPSIDYDRDTTIVNQSPDSLQPSSPLQDNMSQDAQETQATPIWADLSWII